MFVTKWAERTLGLITSVVLFAMMALTFVDVSGRKFFTKPIYGAYEITEFLLGTLIFSALPLVTARAGHVTIDVFDSFVPKGLRRFQNFIVTLISAIVLAIITWRLWLLAPYYAKNNEVSMTLYIPKAPFAQFFAVMTALSAIAALALALAYLRGRRPGTTADASVETAA